jgi:3-oxoacyl-[acyl-carrier-protein] synthase III
MFIESGRYKKVVIVGADKMSAIVDYTDRTTCILFGDGAGAVLLEPNYEGMVYLILFLKVMVVVGIIYIRKQVVRKDLHRMKQLTTKNILFTRMVSLFSNLRKRNGRCKCRTFRKK